MGYQIVQKKISDKSNLELVKKEIQAENPVCIINLVDDYMNQLHILNEMKIPYTGTSFESIVLTSDKVLAKQIMKACKILTPEYIYAGAKLPEKFVPGKYILKPIDGGASLGITQNSVRNFTTGEEILQAMEEEKKSTGYNYFAEEYIEGREFTVGFLGHKMLPIAEYVFNYPDSLHKIKTWNFKWVKDTFEYNNVSKTYMDETTPEKELYQRLIDTTMQCFRAFNLLGYNRIDIRVDKNNNVYILEINTNPGLNVNQGSSFLAACTKVGISYKQFVEMYMSDLRN